jgi:hypothetical protein
LKFKYILHIMQKLTAAPAAPPAAATFLGAPATFPAAAAGFFVTLAMVLLRAFITSSAGNEHSAARNKKWFQVKI